MNMNLGKFQVVVRNRQAWSAAVHGVEKKESDTTGKLNNNIPVINYFI